MRGRSALQRLKLILLGGAGIPEPLLQQAGELGLPVFASYGCTEMASQVATGPLRKRENRWQTAAAVLPHRELRIDDSGAIHVRGKTRFLGYLTDSGIQPPFDAEGWFATGDLGRWDGERLEVLGRKDVMFITGGENVFSSEVEACLYRHPAVQECAVVGIPDETYGEALLAVIVPTPDTEVSSKTLISHCRSHIGGYKIPRRYEFVEELPKSAMNKVLKNELRRVYSTAGNSEATASVMTSPNNISPAQKD